jgi:hypothetical protein
MMSKDRLERIEKKLEGNCIPTYLKIEEQYGKLVRVPADFSNDAEEDMNWLINELKNYLK